MKNKKLLALFIAAVMSFCVGVSFTACKPQNDNSGTGDENGDNSGNTGGNNENGDKTLEETTVYMVGDSTMCEYAQNEGGRYLPRYGYGMELGLYLDGKATIENLAASGRSSISFPNESQENYAKLANIKKGDYLIIGFGHNEQKRDTDHYTNANLSYTDDTQFYGRDASFKKVLYDKYVKPALDKEATPILFTPIVRLNNKDNYTADSGHITADKTENGITYAGGDYAKAIRDLGKELNLTVIDLTKITKNDCETLKYETASNYYSFTGGKWSNGVDSPVIRDEASIDTTHTNLFGAKMNAYNAACELKKSGNPLGEYVKENIEKPTYEKDYAAGINTGYKPASYVPFDPATTVKSSIWTSIKSPWYGTAFGDLGGNPSATNYKITQNSENSFTVGGLSSSKGKISDSAEGIAAVFRQIEADKDFSITATVSIDKYEGTSQTGFGIMLRDDIYIDQNVKTIQSNYVAAGSYVKEGVINTLYSRSSATKITNSNIHASFEQGDNVTLTIQKTGNSITVSFGSQSLTYNDFNLNDIDRDYNYICLYATRNTTVTFKNVNLTVS